MSSLWDRVFGQPEIGQQNSRPETQQEYLGMQNSGAMQQAYNPYQYNATAQTQQGLADTSVLTSTGDMWISAPVSSAGQSFQFPTYRHPDEPTQREKDSGAMDIPVATLVDAWNARFGSKWVSDAELEKEPFFLCAKRRLTQLGRIERCFFSDKGQYVCRVPE